MGKVKTIQISEELHKQLKLEAVKLGVPLYTLISRWAEEQLKKKEPEE